MMNTILKSIVTIALAAFIVACGDNSEKKASTTTPEASKPSQAMEQTAKESMGPSMTNTMDKQALQDQAIALYKANKFPEALEAFKKAAEAGHSNAMFFLGVMHEKGQGTPVDMEKAMSWYQKSSDLENGAAIKRLKEGKL